MEHRGKTAPGAREASADAGSASENSGVWHSVPSRSLCLPNERVGFVNFTLKVTSLTYSGAILAPSSDPSHFHPQLLSGWLASCRGVGGFLIVFVSLCCSLLYQDSPLGRPQPRAIKTGTEGSPSNCSAVNLKKVVRGERPKRLTMRFENLFQISMRVGSVFFHLCVLL